MVLFWFSLFTERKIYRLTECKQRASWRGRDGGQQAPRAKPNSVLFLARAAALRTLCACLTAAFLSCFCISLLRNFSTYLPVFASHTSVEYSGSNRFLFEDLTFFLFLCFLVSFRFVSFCFFSRSIFPVSCCARCKFLWRR